MNYVRYIHGLREKTMEVKKGQSALPAGNPERGPLASSPPECAWPL